MDERPTVPTSAPTTGVGRSRGRARGVVLQADPTAAAAAGTRPQGSGSPGRPLEARVFGLSLSPHGSDPGSNGNGNGHGNGNGNGRVEARGAFQPRELNEEMFDVIHTDFDPAKKLGDQGTIIQLTANYFPTRTTNSFELHHYRVDFSPEQDRTFIKKRLMRPYAGFGPGAFQLSFIFDGSSLWSMAPIPQSLLEITTEYDGHPILIKMRLVALLVPGDVMYMQFFNILVRKCLQELELTQMGRNYFDHTQGIGMPNHRLELWPGFVTTLRQHDAGLLYCVEITHKVLRTDDVFSLIRTIRQENEGRGGMAAVKEAVSAQLVGTIVMTTYNRKTYRVDDIAWTTRPTNTFRGRDGQEITFVDYYKQTHKVDITNLMQPLLISNRKQNDIRRGLTDPFLLVPEFCRMTGLNDQMRSNFTLMKDLGTHLFQPPDKKVQCITDFVRRLRSNAKVGAELKGWGLQIGPNPIKVQGRILPREAVKFKNPAAPGLLDFNVDEKADFTMACRSQKMVSCVDLNTWVILVPPRDEPNLANLVRTMQNVARKLGFNISNETERIPMGRVGPNDYAMAVQNVYNKYGPKLQLVFVVLPNNKLEVYAAVKKRCYVDYGLSSQCFLSKNVASKGIMSIATKVVVQMNAKLGGVPWNIQIPLKLMMVIGFDVYHGGVGSTASSIGAMASTTDDAFGKYFSCVSMFQGREELSTAMAKDVVKCCQAYRKQNNGRLPARIIFYRDGVGEGQLHFVFHSELEAIKDELAAAYRDNGEEAPKLTFIIVTKRINTRLFRTLESGGFENPPPGSVVDSSVTLPERWDFFLVAQQARQGVVSPTNYNVIFDRNGLDANKVQRLSYKLCHLYYNWSGTVAVPAVCQYAHKLAYLTGLATQRPNSVNLSHLLYFL